MTETPPPYFPQAINEGANEARYRKFKMIVAAVAALLILGLAGLIAAVVYLIKALI